MQKLFYNGPIITMETADPVKALLIEDDIVRFAGSLEEAETLVKKEVKRVDLKGHTLLPAFIDPHSHFSMAADYFLQVHLEDTKCFDDIIKKLRDYIEENQIEPGKWVKATGYDQNFLAEKRHPDAAVLDKAAPNNPVIIRHVSGHMGVLNTYALKCLKVPNREDAYEGGRVEIKDGKATGFLEENAFGMAGSAAPMPSMEDYLEGFRKAQKWYLSNGITVAQDGAFTEPLIPIYKELLAADILKIDVVGYPLCMFGDDAVYKAFADLPQDSHFRLGGLKMLLDGSPQGRTAWMREPYVDSADYRAYGTLPDAAAYNNILKAAKENKQLLAHCNGDAAAEQYISLIEKAEAEGYDVAKVRPVLIHGQLLGRDQLPRVKKAGIIPSFFVAHTLRWGDVHLKNFGKERADYISPAGSALREGILFTFHQDTPIIPCDMIETLWCAVNRITRAGVQLSKEERISVFEALRAVTINAAYQYFEEDIRGTLKDGKKADFIILSENPLTYPPENLRDIKVLATFKNGENVWKA